MAKRVTIADVSRVSGFSPGTVCKALNGNKGVCDEKRRIILKVAEEMHYTGKRANRSANARKVALVFPDSSIVGFSFYESIWKGLRTRAEELRALGLVTVEFRFDGTEKSQLHLLAKILNEMGDSIDALATLIWNEMPFLDILEKYAKKGIPVFTITSDAPSSSRVATLLSNAYQTGRLAAEYLGATIPNSGSVIITGTRRNERSHAQSFQGFEDQMAMTNPDVQIVELYENKSNPQKLLHELEGFLNNMTDVRGIYADNARTTALIGKLLEHNELKNKLRIVGSEVFGESARYLNEGIFDALIDEQPFIHGYYGMSMIYDYIIRGIKPNQINYVDINLVFQNNLPNLY